MPSCHKPDVSSITETFPPLLLTLLGTKVRGVTEKKSFKFPKENWRENRSGSPPLRTPVGWEPPQSTHNKPRSQTGEADLTHPLFTSHTGVTGPGVTWPHQQKSSSRSPLTVVPTIPAPSKLAEHPAEALDYRQGKTRLCWLEDTAGGNISAAWAAWAGRLAWRVLAEVFSKQTQCRAAQMGWGRRCKHFKGPSQHCHGWVTPADNHSLTPTVDPLRVWGLS